jgi:hypothetical protein
MPIDRVGEKLRLYDDWSRSAECRDYLIQFGNRFDQRQLSINFRLLVIVRSRHAAGDNRRLADILAESLALSSTMRDRIWLTTAAALQAHQYDPSPLSPALWIRSRESRRWLTEYRNHVARLQGDRNRTPRSAKRAFVAERVASMSRHALFPTAQDALRI